MHKAIFVEVVVRGRLLRSSGSHGGRCASMMGLGDSMDEMDLMDEMDEHGRTRTNTDGHGRTGRTRTDTDEHGRARTNTD